MPKVMPFQWFEQNEVMNRDSQIVVGTRICDPWGREGIVLSINGAAEPVTSECPESITVTLVADQREEHYTLWGWKRDIRVLD